MNLRHAIPLITLFCLQVTPVFAQDSFKVILKEIEDRKAVLATVQTVDMTPARARIGGTVTELLVDEGSNVKEGEVIARIKDEKLKLEMQAVQARISSLQAERKLAEIALNRAQSLRKSGAGSQARLDESRTNLDVAVKNLKAMNSERELILQREREGAVLSPSNGRVINVKVTTGGVVLPGEPIAQIAEETYILRIEVPERHARFIKIGDSVQVGERGMSTVSETMRTGTVRQVYPEMQNGRVVADVEVGGLRDFFIGERIRAFVSTGTRKAFVVPEGYIFNRYGLHYVRLQDGREVVVQPGRLVEGQQEVLSGVRDGDVLVKVTS
jgi:RND family efflux transporter MFP subunit